VAHLLQRFPDGVGGRHRVSTRCLSDGQNGVWFAIVKRHDIVEFGPQFRPSHVLDPHDGAVPVGANGDGGELLGGLEQVLNNDGSVQTLCIQCRCPTKLPGGNFHVVRSQRQDHISHGQLVIGKLVGVQPDSHSVLRTESHDLADPRHTRQHFLQVGLGIIPQVIAIHAAVFRDESHHDQVIPCGFTDLDAGTLDHFRQAGHGELELVLHLGPGQVRVGSRLERQLDARSPR